MVGRTGALFSCGSISDPFKNKVIIELKGNRDFGMGVRAMGARSGGIIALHGETSNSQYVRLAMTMVAGSFTAKVNDVATVSRWKTGDKVVISTTSFYPDRNDELIVQHIGAD
eukprot:scaffold229602_cov60-Attheya_sp.AAC.1